MPQPGQQYWAFLSYSHDDLRWADWLHRALERFDVPRRFVGQPTAIGPAPRRLRPIFRDREDLGAAADLGEHLCSALRQSGYLIVLCSRTAAASPWVEEEVRQFKAYHGEERVLAIIVDGEPFASDDPSHADQECFPRALRAHLRADGSVGSRRAQPVAADLRPGKGGRRIALLKLLSGMLRVDLDQLVQRDAHRRQQQLMALTGLTAAIAAVLGALAIVAVLERNEAVLQRTQAEGLIEFMIGDLRKKLEPAGRLDAMDAAARRALTYYAAQKSRSLTAQALGRRSRVLHMLGEIRERRGDLGAALANFQEASRSTAELLDRHPDDPQRVFDHAQSVYWIGYIAWRRGQDSVARRAFEEYLRLADRLVSMDPNNQDWLAEVAYANSNLGTVLMDEGRADEAAEAFHRVLTISATLAHRAPGDRDRQMDLGQSYAWLADAEVLRGHLDLALKRRAEEAEIYGRLLAHAPSDDATVVALAFSRAAVARLLLSQGHTRQAIVKLTTAVDDLERVMTSSPDDTSYQRVGAVTVLSLGQASLQAGELYEARRHADRAQALIEALLRQDPTLMDWQGTQLGSVRMLKVKIAAEGASSLLRRAASLEPAVTEANRLWALSAARPHNLALASTTAEAALLAGDYAGMTGAHSQALAWWARASMVLERAGAARLPQSDRSQAILRQIAHRLPVSHGTTDVIAGAPAVRFPAGATGTDYRW